MNVALQERIVESPVIETIRDRKIWVWLLAMGIVQIVAGTLAISFALIATLVSVVMLGILLLVAAAGQTAAAVMARDWGGFALFLLIGIVYAVAGVLTIQHPLLAAEGLTLMLAAIYLVSGTVRIIIALVEPVPSRLWVLLNGVISAALGILIWQQWPTSGLWVLGLFIGIDVIINGVMWLTLAMTVRRRMSHQTTDRA